MLTYLATGRREYKMFIDKTRKGLVRGTVTIRQEHGEFEPITAYTFWYRHDEPNLEDVLQKATDDLVRFYFKDHWRCSGAMIGIEWMDYIS